MNKFGRKSSDNLCTATTILQKAAHIVLAIKDHSVLKGHRGQDEQDEAYYAEPQRSKVSWPNGKHNGLPSLAIDVQTYPRPKKKQKLREEQYYLLGMYVGVLHMLGKKARTGADWDQDGEISDNGWDDLFHVEIKD